MKRSIEPKPRLTSEQVKQRIQAAHAKDQKPDFQGSNLYGLDLEAFDFKGANLSHVDLGRANLRRTNFSQANLQAANLFEANLNQANLHTASLFRANLHRANLKEANLSQADIQNANLFEANLGRAILEGSLLTEADIEGAYLNWANFQNAYLKGAGLHAASLRGTDFSNADLRNADLSRINLINTNFVNANLTGCSVYGVSTWELNLEGAEQSNLIISAPGEPVISVDGLEFAQFIYLFLRHQKIREVAGIMGKKVVLIVGHFPAEREAILNGLQNELRHRGYVLVSFNCENIASGPLTNALSTLASLARFIIADLTNAENIWQELEDIVLGLPSVPVQPLLVASAPENRRLSIYSRHYAWILASCRYDNLYHLLNNLDEKILQPVETAAAEIETRRLTSLR